MANIVLTDELGGFKWLGDFFSWNATLTSSSETEARYTDDTGSQTVLIGTGLQFTGDALTGGTVTAVQLLDENGALLVDITGGNYSAQDLKAGSFWEFVSALSAGNDTITGGDGGIDMNVIGLNAGNDTIIAGDGGSNMGGSEGKDVYTGGADWDSLSFEDSIWWDDVKHGVTVNVAKGTVIDNWGDKDTFSGLEEYRGSHFKDTFIGSSGEDVFCGLEGDDKINGGGGSDTLRYHRDQHTGGKKGIAADLDKGIVVDGFGDKDKVSNIENVYGTYKNDKFVGDDNDNQFRGISGKDSFNGGDGNDTISFYWWEDLGQHGVEVNLALKNGQIIDDGFGNKENAKNIENLEGSMLGDILTLGKKGGYAWGDDGDDTLAAGKAGDWLGGGEGRDTFVFGSVAAISVDAGGAQSIIDDFSQADGEKIDLSAIPGLSFIGGDAFGNVAGQVRFEIISGNTFVTIDVDGNGQADATLELHGAITLTAGDFTLV